MNELLSSTSATSPEQATRTGAGRFFRVLGGMFLLLFALLFLYFDVSGFIQYFTRRELRSTTGKVTASHVKGQRSNGRVKMWSYTPEVHYELTVDGQTYKRERIGFWLYFQGNKGVADSVVGRYPPGSSVQVWYDPADPRNSVLDTGFKWLPVWRLVAFLAVFYLAIRIVLNNLVRETWAHTTHNVLCTRRYTRIDIGCIVACVVIFVPMVFNLVWFE